MNYAKPLLIAVALASLTLTACTSATGEVEEQVGTAEQAALSFNALSFNGLHSDPLVVNDLNDPNAREVFKYIVNCALPADAVIDVTNASGSFSFPGGLGLAPEWGEEGGSCGQNCQQWVSACVISRLDFLGETVEISLRGDNPGLQTSASELATYTQREATYYGDIFSVPQRLFACLSPGLTEDPRVCGPTIHGCGVEVLGSCTELCGPPRADGSFPNCVGPRANDGDPAWLGLADIYPGSITVYLQP